MFLLVQINDRRNNRSNSSHARFWTVEVVLLDYLRQYRTKSSKDEIERGDQSLEGADVTNEPNV